MTHDYDRNIFGNKGVGFAECAMSICIRRNYTYFSTTDHGAWRSNGHDTSQWLKISDNPGMPKDDKDRLADPIAVSEDETIIYLVSHLDGWSDTYHNHKLMFSGDMGETWQDVTEVLGLGPVIEDGIQWIFIDPGNPQNQWVFSGEKLYISIDKGKSFKSSSKTG